MTGGRLKPEPRRSLSYVKEHLGKTGEVLVDTIIRLQRVNKKARARLREHIDSGLGDVATTADAAKAEATEAKKAAEKAATAAETAQVSAKAAQDSAEEASQNASSMADDTKKATQDAASAVETAQRAEQTATAADSRIEKVLESLKLTVLAKGKTVQLEGAQTLEFVLKKVNELLTSYNALKKEVAEAKQGASNALEARVDEIENEGSEAIADVIQRLGALEERVTEMETEASEALGNVIRRLDDMEGGKS